MNIDKSQAQGVTLPALFIKLESLAIVAAAIGLYFRQGFSGWILALLLFAPDLAIVAYAFGPRAGSLAYNLAHSYAFPAALGLAGALLGQPLAMQLALIWAAHIALDRLLGYGLKYPTRFQDTHLARI